MLTIDTRSYDQNVGRLHSAVQQAGLRTVKSMALAAKDGLLAALAKAIDKPTPFTLSSSGYQASNGTMDGGEPSATFEIKPLQAAYLKFLFEGGTRVPGDAGTSAKQMWVPTTDNPDSKNKYGGVPKGMSNKEYAMTLREPGATTGKAKWSQGGAFYGKIGDQTGFWARPKRTAPLYKTVKLRGGKTKQVMVRKAGVINVVNKGKPVFLLEAEKATVYHQKITLDSIYEAARAKGADGFNRRLSDELQKRGLI